jgi:DNA-binding transcriptional regulator YiaG
MCKGIKSYFVSKSRAYQIRDSPLTWAIRSMRRRRRLGQVKFTMLVLGRYVSGSVSRWESGQTMPRAENLLRLLRLCETPEEHAAIVEALHVRGLNKTIPPWPDLSASSASAAPPNDSIAPKAEGGQCLI